MAKPIKMPKLSDEMTEGKLAEWLKNEGDEIKAGEVVAQVETEKATLDVEAFEPGVLIGIVVQKGETAPVGSPIAWLGERGEKVPGALPRGAPDVAEAKAGETPAARRSTPPAPTAGAHEALRVVAARTPRAGGRVIASPVARRAARERGIDLSALAGSGPGGRVVLADLERAPRALEAPAAPAARRRRELPPRKALRDETLPLSPMRKAIARNLGQVKPGAPHFYLEISADMRRAVALREQLNELGEGEVSVNDVVLKAVADALLRHPEVNASWEAQGIVRHRGVHVGMAVAIEDGLITPVLRDADRLSIFEIARTAKELARRARDKRLKPEEYQGGTFTVSNLGMFGIEAFYAIINPPEAAILSVGAVQRVPWVDEASGELVARERCRFGLSGDHRVIDGATGARFLQTLKGVIESPVRLVVPPAGS
jgi:pyruvate dehydrogenase E2 component (dihydrolipoamide acetyltransferase)